MQLFCTAVVILVFYVVVGTSLERSSSKKMAWGKPPNKVPKESERQQAYEIILKKVELDVPSGDLVGEETRFDVVMYNETKSVVNGVLFVLKDVSPNLMVQVKGSRFSKTNQWIPMFDQGERVFCEYYETNKSFMKNVLDASNIKECPLKKGEYTIKNMAVDENGFPPGIPDSDFKIDATFTIDKKQIGRVLVYAEVRQKEDD